MDNSQHTHFTTSAEIEKKQAMEHSSTSKSQRLIGIDFFRGAALLVIFWNHLQWVLQFGHPLRYGFSDAAAVFVFLSGYVSGLVYWKVYTRNNFVDVLLKAWRRAGQLYLTHIVSLAALTGIAALMPEVNLPYPLLLFVESLKEEPYSVIFNVLTLQYFPPLFDILPLYIVLMVTVPLILLVVERDWKIVFAIAFSLWCATQIMSAAGIHLLPESWTFNPLSWLIVFAMAITMGVKYLQNRLSIPVKQSYIALACCVVLYAFSDLTTVNSVLRHLGLLTESTAVLFPSPFPLIGKNILEPIYLLHFACFAYLMFVLTRSVDWTMTAPWTKAIAFCGQHSLALFSTGIVLVYVFATAIIHYGFNIWAFYFFELLGWTITIALGLFLSQNGKHRKAPQPLILPELSEHRN